MRRMFVAMVAAAIAIAASIGMPGSASAQVVVIIGNGAAQPYYAQPFPYANPFPYAHPFPYAQPFSAPHVVYREPYPAYGYAAGYYGAYGNGYYGNGYHQPYDYGW